MNAKVQEFIDKMIEKQKGEELKQREELLISLGLIDEEKTKRGIVYLDNWDGTKDCKFDNEKNKYYKESFVPAAIEITDEEYQEILKYAPIIKDIKAAGATPSETKWAKIIEFIAYIYLIGGILINILAIASTNEYLRENTPVVAECLSTIFYVCISFPFVMGFSRIVAAAEKKTLTPVCLF